MIEYNELHKHALSLTTKTQNVREKLSQVLKVVFILCMFLCTFCCLCSMLWQWLIYCTGSCAKALRCSCNILQVNVCSVIQHYATDCSLHLLDCYLYTDNGKLTTRLYDKRDDFDFPIVNFPLLSSNIPSAPVYGVYVSQLFRYATACPHYHDFMECSKVLTTN